jgi:CBS domain-containing protein
MRSTDPGSTSKPAGRRPVAADLVTVDSRSCSPFSTVLEAALVFRDEDCGTLPVLDAGKLLGVVTDRDIALGVPEYPDLAARPVSDVMSRAVAEVRPDESLNAIEARFARERVRDLVVIDSAGRMVGVIAWCDLIKHLQDGRLGGVIAP